MKDSFSRNFLTLLSGSLVGQVINIIVSPIITRLFSPEIFGYFGVFNSLTSILTSLTTLKLEMALPLKKDKDEYSELFWTIVIVNLFISIAVGLIFGLIPISLYAHFGLSWLKEYWILIAICLFFTGINRIFNSAVVRYKEFKAISKSFLNQIIIKNAFHIGVGFFYPTAFVLVVGIILNQITSTYNLLRLLISKNVIGRINFFNKGMLRKNLAEHKDYIIYGTPSGFVNTLGLYLPVPLVMSTYGAAAAGSLSFGITLISLPMKVIGMSLAQVFVGEAAEMIREGKNGLVKLYDDLVKKLSLFIFPPMLIVFFFGESIFPFVFGKEWLEAGVFIEILTFSFSFQFISSPLSQILNLLRLQRVQLIWDIARLLITISSLLIPYIMGLPVVLAISFFSGGMTLSYIVLLLLCRKFVKKRELNLK